MGDRLGIPGAVDNLFYLLPFVLEIDGLLFSVHVLDFVKNPSAGYA